MREDKVDIETMRPSEMKYALEQILTQPFTILITLFQHSFSLLNWFEYPDNPVADSDKIKKMDCAIQTVINTEGLYFVSENDLINIKPLEKEDALASQIVWKSNIRGIYYTYQKAKYIAKRNRKAKMLVIFIRGVGIIGILLFLLFLLVL